MGQKPPLKPKDIWAIRTRLRLDCRARELAFFKLAINSKLLGCHVVRLRVYNGVQGRRKPHEPRPCSARPDGRFRVLWWRTGRKAPIDPEPTPGEPDKMWQSARWFGRFAPFGSTRAGPGAGTRV